MLLFYKQAAGESSEGHVHHEREPVRAYSKESLYLVI